MESSAARLRTTQWVVIAVWIVASTVLTFMDISHATGNRRSPWGCALALIGSVLHGMWISLDARILNRPVGGWRFAAFFLGPFAIWAWLIREYGRKAFYMIPISIAIYLVPVAQLLFVDMMGYITIDVE
jgi:drug/metabolite transporter (DMT)-like permease